MKKSTLILTVLFILFLLAAGTGVVRAIPITFTGDVAADFPAFSLYPDRGGVGDVGLPVGAPMGTATGWDLENIGLAYEESSDTLYVGFNMSNGAISGDADGDGDPGSTSSWLSGLTGNDLPDLGGTEAIDILIDVDQSCELGSDTAADFEIVAGVANIADITNFVVATFNQSGPALTTPGAGYTTPVYSGSAFANPSSSQPDFEFQIDNFCADILSLSGTTCTPGVSPIVFAFRARAGSGSDDGIGEDSIACTDVSYTPTAVSLSGPMTATSTAGWVLPVLLAGVLSLAMIGYWWTRTNQSRRQTGSAPPEETAIAATAVGHYQKPNVIYEGELTTRAGSPTGLDPNGINPADLFD